MYINISFFKFKNRERTSKEVDHWTGQILKDAQIFPDKTFFKFD
jgi:hypothetical protein